MAINAGPSSYAGGKAAQANTMGSRVARQRPGMGGFRSPMMGMGGGKSTMMGGGPPMGAPPMGGPGQDMGMAPSNPVFGASVMPGMEGTPDSFVGPPPDMGGGRMGGFMPPGGGFTGGRFGMGNIQPMGGGMRPPPRRPMPPMGGGIPTGPSGY